MRIAPGEFASSGTGWNGQEDWPGNPMDRGEAQEAHRRRQ
jgi:hypothetical protein